MTIPFDLFHKKYPNSNKSLELPVVAKQESFNYTVLFAIIFPQPASVEFVNYIYKIFQKYDFFVEFWHLDNSGLKRGNLGELANIINQYKFFTTELDFKQNFSKLDDNFSLNVAISINSISGEGIYNCNLSQDDWYDKLRNVVYDTFKQY
jgi:hypothetical protein